MPGNNDDLLISISTDLTTVKRQLRELGQSVTQATDGVSKKFSDLGKSVDASMTPIQKRINQMVGIPVPTNIKEWKGALAEVSNQTDAVTKGLKLNRAGMMELQASAINAGQALASGMSAARVFEMEGAQVIGAVIQGTEGGIAGLGKSFLSLVGGPIPAVGLALAAIGTAGALAFLEIEKSAISSKDAAKLFKEQLDEIKKAAPDVAKSVEAVFNSPGSTNTLLAGLKLSSTELQGGIQKSLRDLESKVPRSAGIFGGVGDYKGYQQILDLVDEAKNGTITVAKLRDELGKIYLDPNASKSVADLAGKILEASKETQGVENELNALKAASANITDADIKFSDLQKAIVSLKSDDARKEIQALFDKAKDGKIDIVDVAYALQGLSTVHVDLTNQIDSIKKLFEAAINARDALKGLGDVSRVGQNLGQLSPVYSDNGRIENPQQYQVSEQQQAQLEAAGQSAAASMIKGFESFTPNAKWDVNHYRAGFGSSTVTDINGNISEITKDTVVTLDDAQRDLSRRIVEFQEAIQKAIGIDTWKSLSDGQQAALTSIAYNYGHLPDAIVKAIQSGDGPEKVAQAIAALAPDNGGINAGRRKSEAQSYLSGTGYSLKSAGINIDNSVRGSAAAEQSTEKQIAELNAQAAAYSSLTPTVNDYGAAVASAKKEQELLAAAQADGTINNPGVKEYIASLAGQYGNATAAMNRAREAQNNLKKSIQEASDAARDFTGTFIDDMIDGKSAAESFGDVLKALGKRLEDLALDELFGGGSVKNGGLFGQLFGSLFSGLHLADGGRVSGPGTARSDSVPAWLSNGEFVVNADATKKFGPFLDAINGGKIAHFASGGAVNAIRLPQMPSIVHVPAMPSRIPIEIHVASDIDQSGNIVPMITHVSSGVADVKIATFNKALPGKVAHYTKNPRLR